MTRAEPHFFGYFDKCPWSPDGSRLLAGRPAQSARPPSRSDVLTVGYVDAERGDFVPLADTTAWSWQQGAMLQWLSPSEVLYNARDEKVITVVHDVYTGRQRTLPRPICHLRGDGSEALSLDFHRLQVTRPGYGYPPALHLTPDRFAPDDDGLWRLDLSSGEARLVLSFACAAALTGASGAGEAWHWFDHPAYSPDGTRIALLHRFRQRGEGWATHFLTLGSDGTELCLLDTVGAISHFTWRDAHELVAFAACSIPPARGASASGPGYVRFRDRSLWRQPLGMGLLTRDGHMSFSPDGRWLVTDEYPDQNDQRTLILFDTLRGERMDLGRFWSPPYLEGELRCDLHPRLNRDGTQVCFDSAHTGQRQVYVMDISDTTHHG